MRLHRLTGLEQDKLTDEYRQLLDDHPRPDRDPGKSRQAAGRDPRRAGRDQGSTTAMRAAREIQRTQEDLDIARPDRAGRRGGHAVACRLRASASRSSTYRAQRRGGKGRSATAMKDEDFVEKLWIVNTHDTLLTFTSTGRVYWLKVYQIPEAGPGARGKPIVNLLPLERGEKVQAVLPVREYAEDRFVFFATRNGTVKKTPLTEFAFQLQKGKLAIGLDEGDGLVEAELTDGNCDILLFASNGKAARFAGSEVRSMGRTATGVRGMRLADDAHVVSMIVADGADAARTCSPPPNAATASARRSRISRARAAARRA